MLLAAGLNAQCQLAESDGDLERFTRIGSNTDRILLSTWSNLVVQSSRWIVTSGHKPWRSQLEEDVVFHSVIGNQNGLLAALDGEGRLYLSSTSSDTAQKSLRGIAAETSSPAALLAVAGNGRIVCTQQAPEGDTQVAEFSSLQAFVAWYSDPRETPTAQHTVPGTTRQLLAGIGNFALLMSDDSIYTWGDPRYRSLARSTVEGDAIPADRPGIVDALAGLRLKKIVLGGWMGGAVSEDGAAYIWGSSMPGTPAVIKSLKPAPDGERVALVDIAVSNDEEPHVVDLDIGHGHAVLVTADGKVYAVGENKHGQLGFDTERPFFERWTQVTNVEAVTQVVCGPKSTFLFSEA